MFSNLLLLNHRIIKKSLNVEFKLLKHGYRPFISSLFMGIVAYLVWFDINFLLGYVTKVVFM